MDKAENVFTLENARSRAIQTWTLDSAGLTCLDHPPVPLSSIAEINLLFVSGGEYSSAHFSCRIYCHDGKTLFLRATIGDAPRLLEYKRFVLALHAVLSQSAHRVQFTKGMRSKLGYKLFWWSMMVTFAGLECLILYAVWHVGKPVMGAIFLILVAIAGYFLLRLIQRLLKPGNYDPREIDPGLLPRT